MASMVASAGEVAPIDEVEVAAATAGALSIRVQAASARSAKATADMRIALVMNSSPDPSGFLVPRGVAGTGAAILA